MSENVILSNSYDITQQPLPKLKFARYQTKRPSISPFTFAGTYVFWDGFENEVRKNFLSQQWGNSVISVRRIHPGPHDLSNEMFLVGDELSLSGRFVQQVLHVMTAVGHDLKIPIRFGDHKTVDPNERRHGNEELGRQSAVVLFQPENGVDGSTTTDQPSSEEPDYAALDDRERARFVGELKTPWTQNFSTLQKDERKWRRHLGK